MAARYPTQAAVRQRGWRSFAEELLEASPIRRRRKVAAGVLLNVDRRGGKAERRRGRALAIARSERQDRADACRRASRLLPMRRCPLGGLPRLGTRALPPWRLEPTIGCGLSLPRLRRSRRGARKSPRISGRELPEFLQGPQRIGRHCAIEGMRLDRELPLRHRLRARQPEHDRGEAGADAFDPAHFGAPRIACREHEHHATRTGRRQHPRQITTACA